MTAASWPATSSNVSSTSSTRAEGRLRENRPSPPRTERMKYRKTIVRMSAGSSVVAGPMIRLSSCWSTVVCTPSVDSSVSSASTDVVTLRENGM